MINLLFDLLVASLLLTTTINTIGETLPLKVSNYVTLVVIVPETHAESIRKVMGDAGAGKSEHYSHGSFFG
ncbi:hypothetical protein BH09DEP1_BH09DEP1_7940 [soil metagenome]